MSENIENTSVSQEAKNRFVNFAKNLKEGVSITNEDYFTGNKLPPYNFISLNLILKAF